MKNEEKKKKKEKSREKKEMYLFCSVRGWAHILCLSFYHQRVYKTATLLNRMKKTTHHTHA